jgi:hypothetical protein
MEAEGEIQGRVGALYRSLLGDKIKWSDRITG